MLNEGCVIPCTVAPRPVEYAFVSMQRDNILFHFDILWASLPDPMFIIYRMITLLHNASITVIMGICWFENYSEFKLPLMSSRLANWLSLPCHLRVVFPAPQMFCGIGNHKLQDRLAKSDLTCLFRISH